MALRKSVQDVLYQGKSKLRPIYLYARQQTTAAATQDKDPEWDNAQPYAQIPGPKPVKALGKFGNVWRSVFGEFKGLSLTEIQSHLFNEYGPIVNLSAFGRPDIIFISDPVDAEKIFRTEGPWPVRRGIESLDYYRRHNKTDIFGGNVGLGTSQGKEWQETRSAVNQPMMRPKNFTIYQSPIDTVNDEFIERIRALRDENLEMPEDFANELCKWALESVGVMALDTRLGCFDGTLKPDSDAQIFINSVNTMFNMLYHLDFRPSMYKYYPTRNWRKLVKAMDDITDISLKLVNKKKEEIKKRQKVEGGTQSILESLLNSQAGEKIAIIMAIDAITAGIDTTSHTLAVLMYHLSQNPEAQDKVFEEVKRLMPTKLDGLPANYDSNIPYIKACIKESTRLGTITGGNSRDTVRDIVLQGYQIPKGTNVLIANKYMSSKDENFPRASEFIPERWLLEKDSPMSAKNAHPFLVMPFGFGPRMCVGRRIADLELRTGIAKIMRNFKVSFNYEWKWQQQVLITPGSPLKFKMEDRAD